MVPAVGDYKIIERALQNLSREQTENLAQKAAEVALDLEKKKVEQRINYEQGRQVLERHTEVFDRRDKSGVFTRHEITTEANLGGGRIHVTSKSGATCFVATATFCDPGHETVRSLCRFRDGILVNHYTGRLFIKVYWKIGPLLATAVNQFPSTRAPLKTILTIIAGKLPKGVSIQKLQ